MGVSPGRDVARKTCGVFRGRDALELDPDELRRDIHAAIQQPHGKGHDLRWKNCPPGKRVGPVLSHIDAHILAVWRHGATTVHQFTPEVWHAAVNHHAYGRMQEKPSQRVNSVVFLSCHPSFWPERMTGLIPEAKTSCTEELFVFHSESGASAFAGWFSGRGSEHNARTEFRVLVPGSGSAQRQRINRLASERWICCRRISIPAPFAVLSLLWKSLPAGFVSCVDLDR